MDDKFEDGVKMDRDYQNLREKSKNIKADFSLNEKGLMQYKNKLYVPNVQ